MNFEGFVDFSLHLMEEGAKVRLVRCPKCENLLTELPNVAVYQCGGCGTVLQAKKQPNSNGGGSSEKSDDERVRVNSREVVEKVVEGELSDDGSDVSDRQSDGIQLRQRRRDTTSLPNQTSSPKIENQVLIKKHDEETLEQESSGNGRYGRATRDSNDGWGIGNDDDVNRNRGKSVKANMETEVGTNDPQMGVAGRSRRTGQVPDWRSGDRDGLMAYRRTPRAVAEDVRFPVSSYPDEGTSNYHPVSYNPGEILKNQSGSDRVGHLEQDRAELLRKLEELNMLKDQMTRSREMLEKPKERLQVDGRTSPLDPYSDREAWFPEGPSRQHRPPMQTFPSDKQAQRTIYSNHGVEPMPLINRHGIDVQNFYPHPPLMHASTEIPGYGDFTPQVPSLSRPSHQYQQHPSRDYLAAQYMEMDPDHNASFPINTFFHQPACSCVHCYTKRLHSSSQISTGALPTRRFVEAPTNPMFYHPENRGTYGPQGYNSRDVNPPLIRREAPPLVRRQRDVETSGFGQSRPRRVLPVRRNAKHCSPVAGGAPFITCHNCFELLPIPKKLLLIEKSYRKLRCGACSTIISLLFENKRIIASIQEESLPVSPPANGYSVVSVKEDLPQSRAQVTHHGGVSSSDYDSSGYNFHLVETDPASPPFNNRLNLIESEKLQSLASSCSTTSEEEESPDSVIARREVSNSSDQSTKAKGTPPFPRSPLREYASSNQVVNKFEKGNRSKRINQEEVTPTKATSRQNSVKDASVATEMDVSFNEYSNSGVSLEYGEVSREEQVRVSKGAESFFAGLIKKGFRDLSRSHQTEDNDGCNVSINGHTLTDRSVKKAEKQAGKIQPGDYWYDFRAGFWGVMGQPCLGIIPPCIEEFNYGMPKKCAAGNTGVYVNGRELHQKDLDLLASRGLPTETGKAYRVEISGKVFDEDTDEELDNLGRLAPTVEKVKRGFGMRVPRAKAQPL